MPLGFSIIVFSPNEYSGAQSGLSGLYALGAEKQSKAFSTRSSTITDKRSADREVEYNSFAMIVA